MCNVVVVVDVVCLFSVFVGSRVMILSSFTVYPQLILAQRELVKAFDTSDHTHC